MSVELKICSFNIRCDCDKAPNDFPSRAPFILELIQKELPDVIGFQEVTDNIRAWIRENLTDLYLVEGCGRDADYRGEGMTVAFRKDRFEPLEVRNFWLSAEPSKPGTRYGFDQSRCPRMCTAVRLKHHDAAEPFWFYNTHIDHQGQMARLFGAMQVLQDISEHPGHFILTGDMNAKPDAPEIGLLAGYRSITTDATELLGGTFHGYGRLETPVKIDYIFTDLPTDKTRTYMAQPKPVNGTYVSDHCPVFAFVTIE